MIYGNKKIIVFGAGSGGETFLNITKNKYNIVAFVDNDKNKQGKNIDKYPIYSPDAILNLDFDFIIIAISILWAEQVKLQLSRMGVPQSKIILLPKRYDSDLQGNALPFECPNTIELARQMVLFFSKVLDENEVMYFVDYGTLLGIVRDKDILPWDDDIDISVNVEEAKKAEKAVRENMDRLPMRNLLVECQLLNCG